MSRGGLFLIQRNSMITIERLVLDPRRRDITKCK